MQPNTTPYNQPLDAGVIASFKNYFRRKQCYHVLKYICSPTKDPYKVHVLAAIQWATEAWADVKIASIENCWRHTKILPAPGLYERGETELEYRSSPIIGEQAGILADCVGRVRLRSPLTISYLLS